MYCMLSLQPSTRSGTCSVLGRMPPAMALSARRSAKPEAGDRDRDRDRDYQEAWPMLARAGLETLIAL